MTLNKHGQPLNRNFNRSNNMKKSAWGLMGILKGVSADRKLNDSELLFLEQWLRAQEHLREDGDLVDLLDLTGDILADGKIGQAELDDMYSLITDIIDFREMEQLPTPKDSVNELLGIVNGILADGQLTNEEIYKLQAWLDAHPDLEEHGIVALVRDNVRRVLEDGVITEEERAGLKQDLAELSGFSFTETGCAECLSLSFLEEMPANLIIDGSVFCFTGRFLVGPRRILQQKVLTLGGRVASRVSKKVDYLVIGTLASRDWRLSSAGTKIEEALSLKRGGQTLGILSEQVWCRSLREIENAELT